MKDFEEGIQSEKQQQEYEQVSLDFWNFKSYKSDYDSYTSDLDGFSISLEY